MTVNREQVRSALFNALQEDVANEGSFNHLGSANDLRDDASFLNVGIESLDVVEAIMSLEGRFNLDAHGIELPKGDTVGHLIDATLEALRQS